MTKTRAQHRRLYRGTLNPHHPWFEAYWPTLAHKIVHELEPWGMIKLTHWLSTLDQPNTPIRIRTGLNRVLFVDGNTRLAAALLLKQNWPVIVEHYPSATHTVLDPIDAGLITPSRPSSSSGHFKTWRRDLASARALLLTLDLDTTLDPQLQIEQLHIQIAAKRCKAKI